MDSDHGTEFDVNYESDDEVLQIDKLDFVYQILTPDEVLKNMGDTVAEISSVIQLPIATVRTLMNHFKWNQEGLMDRLFGDDQDEIFRQLEIPNPFTTSSQVFENKLDGNEESECEVCFVAFPGSELIGLKCNHRFCYDCWNGHLNSKILDHGTDRISCLQYKCNTLMDQEQCLEILQDSRARQIYKRLITSSFVECNRVLLWCPNPKCEMVIKVEYKQTMERITCSCNFSFCCNCLKDWHSPLSCDLLQKWLTKCEDDSETRNWLVANSKECPKCKNRIEKNGGCNHIACKNKNCRYEFCWICMEVWKEHRFGGGHNCAGESDPDMQRNENTREQRKLAKKELDWYLLHYQRYLAHKQSLELEEILVAKVKVKINQLIEGGVPAVDAWVLEKGVRSLRRCRKTLMYTYPFTYYLKKENNQSFIFRNNQAVLQRATENLSRCLEREIDQFCFAKLKPAFLHLCQFCDDRCNTLEKHVKEGYAGFEGIKDTQWKFTTDPVDSSHSGAIAVAVGFAIVVAITWRHTLVR